MKQLMFSELNETLVAKRLLLTHEEVNNPIFDTPSVFLLFLSNKSNPKG
jgi:hypothetical protein